MRKHSSKKVKDSLFLRERSSKMEKGSFFFRKRFEQKGEKFTIMKNIQIILYLFISFSTYGQINLRGKYIDDSLNEYNYLIFNLDSTFKYRYAFSLMHDIACGEYKINKDTILLYYLTDMRDTCCNKELDVAFHYNSSISLPRPSKLFYRNEKLYMIENGKVINKLTMNSRPQKSWGFHRKYIIFGEFVKNDAYYMIPESKVKWRKNRKTSR